jgi:hypothetical protein
MKMDLDATDAAAGPLVLWVDEPATVQPPALATRPDILDLAGAEVAEAGVAGESRLVKLLYLAVTSRLLAQPCSIALKGPSAGGKSFIVAKTLELFPPAAYYTLSAMSERALIYDSEPLVHRMLVLYEAAGIRGDIASYLVRSLLSEGRINYATVDRSKSGLVARHIDREGPTGLITTTTAVSLHPENETRLLSVTVADTREQTQAVMLATARGSRVGRDRTAWHALQTWLAGRPTPVVQPFAEALAFAIPPVAVRLRRDFSMVLTLVAAHALLHQTSRERDHDGAVVATLQDYDAVRGLVADLVADAAERAVPASIRETVAAITALGPDPLDEGRTYTQVATHLGIDKSSAQRRARKAISRGFIRNLEHRPSLPARLVLGEPLPDDSSLLPTAADLARLQGCTPDRVEQETAEVAYPRSTDVDADDDELDDRPAGVAGQARADP